MQLSQEEYARKMIYNACLVRIENSVTQVNYSASGGKPHDGEQLSWCRNFHSTPHNHERFLFSTMNYKSYYMSHDMMPSLIRVFAVRMKKAWVLSYPLSAQRRLWSDWADAQADLSLRWVHTHFVGFVMSWLILSQQSHLYKHLQVSHDMTKCVFRSFWPGQTQTSLRSHRN